MVMEYEKKKINKYDHTIFRRSSHNLISNGWSNNAMVKQTRNIVREGKDDAGFRRVIGENGADVLKTIAVPERRVKYRPFFVRRSNSAEQIEQQSSTYDNL